MTLTKKQSLSQEKRKGTAAQLKIKYDVGFGNALYIRGKGAGLSWDKGLPLKNTKEDEWVWEPSAPFTACEFKVLINDQHYEIGENHPFTAGSQLSYTPEF